MQSQPGCWQKYAMHMAFFSGGLEDCEQGFEMREYGTRELFEREGGAFFFLIVEVGRQGMTPKAPFHYIGMEGRKYTKIMSILLESLSRRTVLLLSRSPPSMLAQFR